MGLSALVVAAFWMFGLEGALTILAAAVVVILVFWLRTVEHD
jgi:hypothetical protein